MEKKSDDIFILHENLMEKTKICELELCLILSEDDERFPWIMLVPKRNNIQNILDLDERDRNQVWKEIQHCSSIMKKLFNPDRLNIGMIGNVTDQLHVHIVCRYKNDDLFPSVVWGAKLKPHKETNRLEILTKLQKALLDVSVK